MKLEDVIAARAKARQRLSEGRGKKGVPMLAHLFPEPAKTRDLLAKMAGVSHGTRQGSADSQACTFCPTVNFGAVPLSREELF